MVARTLRPHPTMWRPVRAIGNLISSRGAHRVANNSLLPTTFRDKLVFATKWAAPSNDAPSGVASTHSLQAGGATALFAVGVDRVEIQRCRRGRIQFFHEYVWRDASGFLDLGALAAST